MKKFLMGLVAAACFVSFAAPVFAQEGAPEAPAKKEKKAKKHKKAKKGEKTEAAPEGGAAE